MNVVKGFLGTGLLAIDLYTGSAKFSLGLVKK